MGVLPYRGNLLIFFCRFEMSILQTSSAVLSLFCSDRYGAFCRFAGDT